MRPRWHGLGIGEPVRARSPALFRTRQLHFDSTSAKGKGDSRSFDVSGSCRSLDIDYLGAFELGANDRSAGLSDCPSKSGDGRFQGPGCEEVREAFGVSETTIKFPLKNLFETNERVNRRLIFCLVIALNQVGNFQIVAFGSLT